MNQDRKYAEDLVGPLNTSHYDTQRDIIKQAQSTNWQDLSNQYKNLQDRLKKQQEASNIAFNEGLGNVASGSYDRMRSNNANLANKGLSTSGLKNIVEQADTQQKGSEVLDLLAGSGDISANVVSELAGANTDFNKNVAAQAQSTAGALSDVGDSQGSAQMSYNQGLAGLAESKAARDANNALQAAQLAASSSSGSGSTDEEESYRKQGIYEILSSPDLTDDQKQRYLEVLYQVDDGKAAVGSYNYNTQNTDLQNQINMLAGQKQGYYNDMKSTMGNNINNPLQALASPFYNMFSDSYNEGNYGEINKLNQQMIDLQNQQTGLAKGATNSQGLTLEQLLYGVK